MKILYLAILILSCATSVLADDNTRCKIYNNCSYSTRAADKGAELIIEDMNTDAKGNPVAPADMEKHGGANKIGKNVDVELKKPLKKNKSNSEPEGDAATADSTSATKSAVKDVIEGSEVNIGTVRVDTETGKTEIQTPPQPGADKCDYSYLVGKRIGEVTLPKNSRVLHEGDAVTMEYMEGRVNIILDKNDVIVNVTCG